MIKIRAKLIEIKNKLSSQRIYSVIVVIITVISIWGFYQYKRASSYRTELDNQYNRAFFDLIGYVQNVETLLVKAIVTTTPQRTSLTLKEAWREANLAQENLGLIPVSQPVLADTSKFLTQVGDLSYTLSTQNLNNNPISKEQYDTLTNLNTYAYNLRNVLYDLQKEFASGRIKWDDLTEKGTAAFIKTSTSKAASDFENMSKTFKEYPTLIYDGPFSDHMTSLKPKALTGNQIEVEEAKKKAIEFVGEDKVSEVTFVGKNSEGSIKTYTFSIKTKNQIKDSSFNISISQIGGHVIWMLYQRVSDISNINIEDAKKAAKEFLNSKGYSNMKDTYFINEGNVATINFAYEQENVIMYPDLIKVKVSLDNGEIVGFESKGYYFSHHERTITTPKISYEEARKKINPAMEINGSNLSIIPTNFKTEILTYEFKGNINNRDFLVYINAENGQEENILIITETPNGILTI